MKCLYRLRNRAHVQRLFYAVRFDAACDYVQELRAMGVNSRSANILAISKFNLG